MRVETDSSTNTITYLPEDGQQSATVILMHGLGDSADGMSDLAASWCTTHPHIKFVLPTAEQMSVTLNFGSRMNAWYDIVGLDDRASESCEGIEASGERVRALIAAEVAIGVPHSRIALAGFSQGGAMSLFTGLQLDAKLAGLLVMSGYLPGAGKFKLTPGLEDVPVLHCHGSADPVVKLEWAKRTNEGLTKLGMSDYTLQTYPGVQHSISMEILQHASEFLGKILPPDAQFNIKAKLPSEMSTKELLKAIRGHGIGARAAGFTEKHEYVQLLEEHLASKK